MTTETESVSRDAADAAAYRAIEDDLCDVANMAQIASQLIVEADGDSSEKQRSVAFFAVHHVNDMLVQMKAKYDAGGYRPST